jgi:hypothetical protein
MVIGDHSIGYNRTLTGNEPRKGSGLTSEEASVPYGKIPSFFQTNDGLPQN